MKSSYKEWYWKEYNTYSIIFFLSYFSILPLPACIHSFASPLSFREKVGNVNRWEKRQLKKVFMVASAGPSQTTVL